MLDYKPNIVLSHQEYKVVGKRPIRHDGADKVTGQARYGADINLPGMLYGKILRSPHNGVRGVGETPVIPPMAAIANAIYKAIGTRLNQLPMSPGRVLEAMWTGNGAKQNGYA